ncbi:MAG: hypothetical protein AB1705_02460 [Verrucomicrobiota bacterium]
MNPTNPSDKPAPTPAPANGGAAAEQFLAEEVQTARLSLRRTKIVTIVLLVIVGGYMGTITVMLGKFLDPKEAALMANSQISIQVDTHANTISDQLKERIPALISEVPDYVLKMMPELREQMEDRLITEFESFCAEHAGELANHMTDFMKLHKDEIGELLEAADKPDGLKSLGPDLQQAINEYLSMKEDENSESIREKIEKSMIALKEVEKHMNRLATASDLTPSEKKARRAIAIISKTITDKTVVR